MATKIYINDVEKEVVSEDVYKKDTRINAIRRAKEIYKGENFTNAIYGNDKKKVSVKVDNEIVFRISNHGEWRKEA
jgi:ribosomal protein L25 (general stress protein Ctc)